MKIFLTLALAATLVSGCASTANQPYDPATGSLSSRQADLHTRLAWNYLQRGQYKVAGQELDQALRKSPSHSKAHHIYGVLLTQLDRTSEAERHFRRAIQSDPNNLDAQEDFAGFLCQFGRTGEGIDRYRQTMENPLNEQPALTRTRAGLCMMRTGDMAGAETYFREALERSPSIPPALAGMVRISYERGNHLSARGYAERYIAMGESDPDVLLFAAKAEAALGDSETSENYARMLRTRYPNSAQAKLLK